MAFREGDLPEPEPVEGQLLQASASSPLGDAMALAGACGRLYQAITADTARQFKAPEEAAWMCFTDALSRYGITNMPTMED